MSSLEGKGEKIKENIKKGKKEKKIRNIKCTGTGKKQRRKEKKKKTDERNNTEGCMSQGWK